jgi:hypothetical protein
MILADPSWLGNQKATSSWHHIPDEAEQAQAAKMLGYEAGRGGNTWLGMRRCMVVFRLEKLQTIKMLEVPHGSPCSQAP